MKKGITLIAMTALISLAACNSQPKVKTMTTAETPEVAIDSACMKANTGKYMSYDGKKSITLNADGTVECKNTKYNYDSWNVMTKEGDQASCRLSRKGIDQPISISVLMNLTEHSIIVDNETFRMAAKKEIKEKKRFI